MGVDLQENEQYPPPQPAGVIGRGEMARLVRERDWSNTPLGPAEQWPQSLRTAVNILVTSRYAMWMGWGETLTFIYNDAYRPTLGIKHPWALGRPASEVWAEVWDDIRARATTVLNEGEATYDEGLMLFLERSGFAEETYHTFSYSPLSNDDGRVSGMLCVVTEETERVINERRMKTLRELAAGLSASNTEDQLLRSIERHLSANTKDLPFTLLYLFEPGGAARLAATTGISDQHPAAPELITTGESQPWPAEIIYRDSAPQTVDLPSRASEHTPFPSGSWSKPPQRAVVLPISQVGQHEPAGFLVVGLNPFRPHDSAYAGFLDLVAGQISSGIVNARAYAQERRRAEVLVELDRSKTVFFSNVSHEFRTPLTLMLGPVEDMLATAQENASAEQRELLHLVHRNGLRLQRLVNALLDFSRIEAGRVEASYKATDLPALTRDLASSFRSAMERAGLRFTVECAEMSEPAYVDRDMWEKIVLNLVSNAFKYTLEGVVSVRLEQKGGMAELSVSDSGVGIPEGELPHVFERFHRVQGTLGRTHEGTGIGLALVQELVRLHGGTIRVGSVVGVGSTFTVEIPLGKHHLPQDRVNRPGSAKSTAMHADAYLEEALRWLPDQGAVRSSFEDAATPVLQEQSTGAQRSRVLLADDNADMREYVQRLLSAQYDVTAVANGAEALEAAAALEPDLVLSDVMMPVLDGFGLLKGLRENTRTKGVPVILLSARAGEEASVEGLEAGADDYLVKPFTARELLARVGAHLALKQERQRAQERLRQVFWQAPVGILVLRGPEFVVELANPVYQSMFAGRELEGKPLFQIVPEFSGEVREALRFVIETGETFVANDFHLPYDRTRDGRVEDHWFNVLYHPLRDAGDVVTGVIAVCSEVTEQVRARQELERVNRELEEFAYVSSHDLQEPLRMVNAYTQLLMRRHVDANNQDAKQLADFVGKGVHRMEQLIRDLLSYSRALHRGELQPAADLTADLNVSWKEAMTVLDSRIRETGAVIESPQLPTVYGDGAQLAHVFQNLLSNAMKYRKNDVPPHITVSSMLENSMWVITVRDNGIGFEPQYAQGIFGLFKRLHRNEYPGTGLGLAICQRLVERYGGRIWAESTPGVGSTFSIALNPVPGDIQRTGSAANAKA